jgi:hypothetical protein
LPRANQERVVAQLDRDGHDAQEALALLAMFRRTQAKHVTHRNLLLEMLHHNGHQTVRVLSTNGGSSL